jgi:hypothetical protein
MYVPSTLRKNLVETQRHSYSTRRRKQAKTKLETAPSKTKKPRYHFHFSFISIFVKVVTYKSFLRFKQKRLKNDRKSRNIIICTEKKRGKERGTSHPPNLLLTPLATLPKILPLFFSFCGVGAAETVVTDIKVAAIGGGMA